ncbi:hypothetical protein [Bowmanella yangjiangensis]|uniref:Uncharacterized protein n=1 Tax=Bowmanella yangjiangensis TaxID=2811230 RepID=A0ABS3CX65_9ALTE|nr:hypothetical protein [Bowmanella yangjiangensis]MBN7820726.1 hypothetical protein [Bowmanella yangjiangensis]
MLYVFAILAFSLLGVIDIEVQYQQGKINDEQLSVVLQKLAAEALKTQQAAPKLP